MTCKEYAALRNENIAHVLVDVRQLEEFKIVNLGGQLIPLGELAQRFEELDSSQKTVVICHHGIRSGQAVAFLKSQGFEDVHNLSGGIDAWACHIDTTLKRY